MKNLAGKTAIVTGGGSGLGRAIAERLAAEGCQVTVADVDEIFGTAVATAIGGTFIRTDVSSPTEMEALVACTVSRYGRLDLMVNNAGIECPQALLHEVSVETWRRILDVNLGGVFYGMKYAIARFMRQGGGGAVVNMSSVAGIIGYPNISPYAAAKSAVCNLTRAGAVEYGPHGIRVNAVAPTAVATEMNRRQIDRAPDPVALRQLLETMNPLIGMPTPEDVAAAVAFLASDDAAFISGAILPVDGGYTAR
jgi:meso-butanediol dehydrogenase / (S,S)-butanediol dehydrogenase / diacetyl reductase